MLGMRSITRVLARLSLLLSAPRVQTLPSAHSELSLALPLPKLALQLSFSESSLLWIPAEYTKEMMRWGGGKMKPKFRGSCFKSLFKKTQWAGWNIAQEKMLAY